MPHRPAPVVERTLFSWILTSRFKLQILLFVVILVTVFARVLPLEMQKRIVNEAISLRKLDLLFTYCGIYLAAVVSASVLKYLIHTLQTIISESALADMRNALYAHLLTLPLNFYRRTQPGMVVSALITELAVPANFVGLALSVPIINLFTLLAFAAYLLWLNPLLAVVSLSIYPLVIFLVPLLQKRVNRANRERVDTTRKLANLIAEAISGIHEIQAHSGFGIETRRGAKLVADLLGVRVTWNLFKNAIKVFNNLVLGLGPFLVFILGGYLAIHGRLELGALVAFLSAQEKLYDPWKELIDFYQVYQDGRINYKRTMDYFNVPVEHALAPPDRPPYALDGRVAVRDLAFVTDDRIRLLDGVTLDLRAGEHLAVVGFSGSGKSTLALCVGQLYSYTEGHLSIGERDVRDLTKLDMAANVGLISQAPFIFNGTIEDNLLYARRARRPAPADDTAESPPALDDIISVLQQTGIFVDVLRFGMNSRLPADEDQTFIARLIEVRQSYQRHIDDELAEVIEFFDAERYQYHSSIAENLVFGSARDTGLQSTELHASTYFRAFLDTANLTLPLLSLGLQLARQLVDILGNVSADKVFFEKSPIDAEELEPLKDLVQRTRSVRLHNLSGSDRSRLLELSLRFAPGRHKMIALPEMLETLLLEGRSLFRQQISRERPAAVAFYDRAEYIHSQSILNNLFFGKVTSDSPRVQEKIDQSIVRLLIEEDLLERITQIGMQFQVGSKGDRLSGGQRQKLAIARVLLKDPPLLIMDEATSALDNRSQARIQGLLDNRLKGRTTVIAVVHRLDIIEKFDKIAVMKAGKIVEMGGYAELMEKRGHLYGLVGPQ